MVRSLAVVLLLVGAVALVTVRPGGGNDGVREVDYATDLASARVAAPYPVLAPVGLEGFRPTSARFTSTDAGTVWHLGFVSPFDEYVGLDQTDGDEVAFVDTLTEGAAPVIGSAGAVELGGRTWERYDDGGTEAGERVRGLVTRGDGATTVVSGTAGWGELEAMATALSTG